MRPVRGLKKNWLVVTGLSPSPKNRAAAGRPTVWWEGPLEKLYFPRLEFDPEVASYVEQPCSVTYTDAAGKQRHYTPDALVMYRSDTHRRPELVEVKGRKQLRKKWAEYKPAFKAARRYARERGWVFRIVSDRELRTPLTKNARFLLGYRHREVDPEDRANVLEALRVLGEADPRTLLVKLSSDPEEQDRLLFVVWHLVSTHAIGCDLRRQPLTMLSRLWTTSAPKEEA